ncbi:MAG: hypothetical protein LBH16_07675 [Treponema sp.]|nr:hypothetical protein [Treponema sp.]
MRLKKEEKSPDVFWRDFEEKTGEKVLARGLGKYIRGWDEFDNKNWGGLWGLVISTSGGFHFYHFPRNSWFDALTQFADSGQQKEKTFFIPRDEIISSDVVKEVKWYKRLFSSSPPKLVIKYRDESGAEKQALFEAEYAGNYTPADSQ